MTTNGRHRRRFVASRSVGDGIFRSLTALYELEPFHRPRRAAVVLRRRQTEHLTNARLRGHPRRAPQTKREDHCSRHAPHPEAREPALDALGHRAIVSITGSVASPKAAIVIAPVAGDSADAESASAP